MSILVHSCAIPVHSCGFLPIPVDSGAIPADSTGMDPFLQESVGHGEVLHHPPNSALSPPPPLPTTTTGHVSNSINE